MRGGYPATGAGRNQLPRSRVPWASVWQDPNPGTGTCRARAARLQAGRRASHVTTRTFGPFSAGLGPAAPHGPLVPRIRSDKAAARHGRRGHVTVRRTGPQRFGWAGAGPDFPARDEDDPPMTMTHRCERLTCPPRPRLTTFSIYYIFLACWRWCGARPLDSCPPHFLGT